MKTRRDEAVSSVVSAVLIFALFTSASAMYVLNTLPDRIEGKEANNQAQVRQAFGAMKAGLESLSGSGDSGPISASVSLAAQPVPLLQQGAASGTLAVIDGVFAVNASWPDETKALLLDGQSVGVPDAAVPTSGATLWNVSDLRSLVLGLQSNVPSLGATTTLTASTSAVVNGVIVTVSGQVQHSNATAGICAQGPSLIFTLNISGQNPRNQTLACNVSPTIGSSTDPFRVDLRDASLGFLGALQRLPSPLNITLTASTPGLAGTYSAVWVDPDGLIQRAGNGTNYTTPLTMTGDVLRYTPSVFRYVTEEVSWQGGAIIASQGQALQSVVTSPGLRLNRNSTTMTGHLVWTLVDLEGNGEISGAGTATATITHVSTSEQVLVVPAGAVLNLTTPDPTAWLALVNQSRLLAGLNSTEFATMAGANWFKVTLGGSLSWTLHLRLVQARVVVT